MDREYTEYIDSLCEELAASIKQGLRRHAFVVLQSLELEILKLD